MKTGAEHVRELLAIIAELDENMPCPMGAEDVAKVEAARDYAASTPVACCAWCPHNPEHFKHECKGGDCGCPPQPCRYCAELRS